MDHKPKEKERPEPPTAIIDPNTHTAYFRREFLGRGGFARCWEFYDASREKVYAGKVVSKENLQRSSQKAKMKQEIMIHRDLHHKHVVQFFSSFEDREFIYVIVELCNRRTLMELHKRRKTVTEPEARYFSRQVALGCKYLHENNIIHRDLKLANLFLDEELNVKIGDFGLATYVVNDEKKETLCGTPNYIAPEILTKVGHSFQVDTWSLGCILYTLLAGRPPFETKDLEKTYTLIKNNSYRIPTNLTPVVRETIQWLLHAEPKKRPTMVEFLKSAFFINCYTPESLPISCLTTAPRFDHVPQQQMNKDLRTPLRTTQRIHEASQVSSGGELVQNKESAANNFCEYFAKIQHMVKHVIEKANVHPTTDDYILDNSEEPGSSPIYWISRWVDYSDKYGMGYELCDNSYGVLFNDLTRLLQTADDQNLQYIDKYNKEELFTIDSFPDSLRKKIDLLTNFRNYMQENLCKAGENVKRRACDAMARLPFLVAWIRTSFGIMLYLSNGTLQMNFFNDHVKIILCPLMKAISVINQHQKFRTYALAQMEVQGITEDLKTRLGYVLTIMERLKSSQSVLSTNSLPRPPAPQASALSTGDGKKK